MFKFTKKYRIFRKYDEDLWGLLRERRVLNNTFVRFVKLYKERRSPSSMFSQAIITGKRRRRKSLYGELLILRRKLSFFYGGLRPAITFSAVGLKSLKELLEQSITWELRLSSVVYRSHLLGTPLEALSYVLSGRILVNNQVLKNPGYNVRVGDFVELLDSSKVERFEALLLRLKAGSPAVLRPTYLEVNYGVMAVMVLRKPGFREVYYPFSISI